MLDLHNKQNQSKSQRKNRTVIIYFGIFIHYLEIIASKVMYLNIVAVAIANSIVEHKEGCTSTQGYTRHKSRSRKPKNFQGEFYEVPIWQIRCLECGAIFTILPSFLARYQRWDTDAMSKILEINLIMTTSYRHTLKILEYSQRKQLSWNPGSILHIVHWLSNLCDLPGILLRLGLQPPKSLMEDEKFVKENTNQTYVAFLSHQEVIWWAEYLQSSDANYLESSFKSYLAKVRQFYPGYTIEGVTYDGWKPAKKAFEAIAPDIVFQECHLHAQERMSRVLPLLKNQDPSLTDEDLIKIKQQHDYVLESESRAIYSQRLRRFREAFGYLKEVLIRCGSLKKKILYFLAYLFYPLLGLAKFSTSLDQLIKFFDRKFFIMQTFRNSESADKTVRSFAIVRNFWRYMPGSKRKNQSPVEIAGAHLHEIPWLEFVNLASTSNMSPKEHVTILHDT